MWQIAADVAWRTALMYMRPPKTGVTGGLGQAGGQTLAGTGVAMHLHKTVEGDAMSICGVITTREVLKHGATIVREFGAMAYLKCCAAILMRRRTTFLNCVCEFRPD